MKTFVTFAVFGVIVLIAISASAHAQVQAQAQAENSEVGNLENADQGLLKAIDDPVIELVRTKRLTCSIGEWACVAHCNSLGRKSGGCERGVCVCRSR